MDAVLLSAQLLLAALGHWLLWLGIVNRTHSLAGPRWMIRWITRVCIVAFLVVPVVIVGAWLGCNDGLRGLLPGSRLLRTYAIVCLGWAVVEIASRVWHYCLRDPREVLLSTSQNSADLTTAAGTEPFVGTLARRLGNLPGNETLKPTVDRKTLVLANLPPPLANLRIVHVADWHITGRIARGFYAAVAEQILAIGAEAIVITGDIIENESCRDWLAESFGTLTAPLGVYFVLGNHDKFIDAGATHAMLCDFGFTPVGGRVVETNWRDSRVVLVGNEQPWFAAAASEPAPRDDELRIALLHTPDQFNWAQEHKFHLALAGHTHGGQIRLPLLGAFACPSRYGVRYAGGVFESRGTVMHVTRGVSSEAPLRWNCPPEIAVLELVPRE